MIHESAAIMVLDALPIGSQVAAAFVDDADDTATVILFEHRMHEGERRWWDMTRNYVWWTAREIVLAHDDMVVTANPSHTTALSEDHRQAITTALAIASKGAIPEDAAAYAAAFEALRVRPADPKRSQL